ncbi:hypothetical protein [Crocosphaera sp. XPORK-15E]|uniref:hypothetical protein n=1 Tax=Crocosphaera sp. XPORK-15E TaxID=3110247 RepID=UPI002B209758|nr:hypothetical protein [Crocosphaera sp. XPORK-15E]MEA5537038.1 hypothetical protein [Crocosphaera sp. XPORK-15E]
MNQSNKDSSRGYQTDNKGTAYVGDITINQHQQLSKEQAQMIAKLVVKELASEEKKQIKEQDKIQQQTEEINENLKKIERQSPDPNRRSLGFDDWIREIDFDEAKNLFDDILKNFQRRQGAVLLLMHESESKRGDIYLEEIKDSLKKLKTDFKPYSIGLSSDSLLDEEGLLNKIASFFGISERDNQDQKIEEIITTIGDSIRHGTILFFHLSQWDELASPSKTLIWFIQDFWQPLLLKIASVCSTKKYRQVKIITVIDSPGILEEDCLELPFIRRFDPFKIQEITEKNVIEIPLRNWKLEEIDDWLALHTTIEDNEKIAKEARLIYRRNNRGDPQKTSEALKKIWFKNCPINLFNEAG